MCFGPISFDKIFIVSVGIPKPGVRVSFSEAEGLVVSLLLFLSAAVGAVNLGSHVLFNLAQSRDVIPPENLQNHMLSISPRRARER